MVQVIARLLGWRPDGGSGAGDLAALMASPAPGLRVVHGEGLAMPRPLDLEALRIRNRERAAGSATADPSLPR